MNPTAPTEMVDRVFGDRYRIEALLGVGAISAVYTAFDSIAERWVAIKLFDDVVCADERFVERLLEAATQASVLQHTNVATVYDSGYEGEPYIVSELCEGGSLRGLLDAGHRLTASQALIMTLECARALQHGHELGFVHRNLKPQNVLFAGDQRVRITDYGLAKVLSEAPISQASRALENVRYASPEQARGRPVNPSSDLYSLALVINEAVTAEPPKVAETVVGTLMARAESPAELSESLEALLPPLERCGRVDPEQRPEAEELTIALLATAETMARPAALPIVGIDEHEVIAGDAERSDEGHEAEEFADVIPIDGIDGIDEAAPDVFEDDTAFLLDALGPLDDIDDFGDDYDDIAPLDNQMAGFAAGTTSIEPVHRGGLENLEEAEPVFASVPDEDASPLDVPSSASAPRNVRVAYEEPEDDADEQLPWWPLVVLTAVVVAALASWFFFFGTLQSADSAKVPNLVGLDLDEVDSRLGERDWVIETLEARANDGEVGTIIAQNPEVGAELGDGEMLTITVSLGNEMVEIPSDVVGLTLEQAASRLGSVGLALGDITEENSEAFGEGLVVGLDEPITQKPSGQRVAVRVSLGPEERVIPSEVIGLTIAEATDLLTGLRLQAVEEPVYDPDAAVGTVLGTIPTPGEGVAADSPVTLLVSAGPEPVVMPDVIGLPLDEAVDALVALGLIFANTEGLPGEPVIGTLPPIGATVDVGTEVLIYLGEGDEGEEDEEDQ